MKVKVEIDTSELLKKIEYDLDTYRIENVNFHDVERSKVILETLHYAYNVVKDVLENEVINI